MSGLVDCTVLVNGAPFNDGSDPELEGDPVIVTGLKVVWGRSTVIDQPEASTCRFTVNDPTALSESLNVLVAGATIDVDASGVLSDPANLGTFADPALTTTDAVRVLSGRVTAVPGQGLELRPIPGALAWSLTLYPAPPTDDVTGWDHIPKTSPGQTWQGRITFSLPAGGHVRVTPLLFDTPNGANPVRLTASGYYPPPFDTPTLHTIDIPMAQGGKWVGLWVEAGPYYRWNDVGSVTWTGAGAWPGSGRAYSWDELGVIRITNADVWTPSTGTTRTVRVFSGRVTDMQAAYDASIPGLAIDVTAADFSADLDNRRIGDEPWGAEPYPSRFARILELAAADVDARLSDALTPYLVSWVDVDAQPAMSLLRDLTTTVDGVLWPATHATTGPYLFAESPTERASGRVLAERGGIVVIAVDSSALVTALHVSACDVLRDPVQWLQDVTDVVTRVNVTWQEQGTPGPDMGTTERHELFVDTGAETIYGTRAISLSTALTSQTDARAIGGQLQARTSGLGWRIGGLVVDAELVEEPDRAAVEMVCELLDGTARIGRLLVLDDVPGWVPTNIGDTNDIPLYLEGGEYSYEEGAWILGLIASEARASGVSAKWSELDTDWAWSMFDPSISWAGLRGAVIPPPSPAAYPGVIYPSDTYPGVTVSLSGLEPTQWHT